MGYTKKEISKKGTGLVANKMEVIIVANLKGRIVVLVEEN